MELLERCKKGDKEALGLLLYNLFKADDVRHLPLYS